LASRTLQTGGGNGTVASLRVPFETLHAVMVDALLKTGMPADRAALCARLFAETSRDGIASHGLNRFPRFLRMIASGVIDVHARPACVASAGALERWNGRRGPGNLNARESMARAIALARLHGIGCVALAETNHWMRGGSYGWQAADAGAIGLCWTNTLANVPPWGAADARIGNNPLVVAFPRRRGHVVIDMALSQFSVGALTQYAARGERLPVAGGYDADGRLSHDAVAVLASGRLLPVGSWKGSGLSIVLDLIAAALSAGQATHQIPRDPENETGLSQVFIAIDPATLGGEPGIDRLADAALAHLTAGPGDVRYPGARTLEVRARSLRDGVEVEPATWAEVRAAAAG
jgi:3-dehydro-L-gulonate 2-dehydrogenase